MGFLTEFLLLSVLSFVLSQNESVEYTDATTIATETYFSDMPEAIQINYIDATTLLKFDNQGEYISSMMGVSDIHCDNGRVAGTDFDFENVTEIEEHTICFEAEILEINQSLEPVLTIMKTPDRYVPIHKCVFIKINYYERIPSCGPHRYV